MASKINIGETINATIKVDNHLDAKRKYNISAFTNTSQNKVESIHNGEIADKDNDSVIGNFSYWNNGSFNFNIRNISLLSVEEQTELITAVNDFIANVKDCFGDVQESTPNTEL